jgi:hypothetical protein
MASRESQSSSNLHSRQLLQPGRPSLGEAKHIHRWGSRSQGTKIAKREELYCQRADQGMSRRRDFDRERFWERRLAILLLCLDEVVEE